MRMPRRLGWTTATPDQPDGGYRTQPSEGGYESGNAGHCGWWRAALKGKVIGTGWRVAAPSGEHARPGSGSRRSVSPKRSSREGSRTRDGRAPRILARDAAPGRNADSHPRIVRKVISAFQRVSVRASLRDVLELPRSVSSALHTRCAP